MIIISMIKIEGIDKQHGWLLCPICKYLWRKRTAKPKECPRCKGRLDKK